MTKIYIGIEKKWPILISDNQGNETHKQNTFLQNHNQDEFSSILDAELCSTKPWLQHKGRKVWSEFKSSLKEKNLFLDQITFSKSPGFDLFVMSLGDTLLVAWIMTLDNHPLLLDKFHLIKMGTSLFTFFKLYFLKVRNDRISTLISRNISIPQTKVPLAKERMEV